MLLAATACAPSPVIFAANSPCTELLPDEWEKGVGHAPPPKEVPPAKDGSLGAQLDHALAVGKEWIKFGTAEAAQVEKADGRYRDGVGIVRRCEARDAKAVAKSRPRFLGLF